MAVKYLEMEPQMEPLFADLLISPANRAFFRGPLRPLILLRIPRKVTISLGFLRFWSVACDSLRAVSDAYCSGNALGQTVWYGRVMHLVSRPSPLRCTAPDAWCRDMQR
jgi:hypothetical protein